MNKLAPPILSTTFLVCSLSVIGVTFANVASADPNPPCPSSCDDRMGCAGSLCDCHQTGYDSGKRACFQPGS